MNLDTASEPFPTQYPGSYYQSTRVASKLKSPCHPSRKQFGGGVRKKTDSSRLKCLRNEAAKVVKKEILRSSAMKDRQRTVAWSSIKIKPRQHLLIFL